MNKAFEKILDMLKDTAKIEIQLHCGRCNGKTLALGYTKGIENAIKIVQEVAEEYNDGWIACSERLPELDGTYICTCQGIAESITLIFSTHDNLWNDEFEAEYDDVIAWQPLPEPFKERD